MPDKKEKDLWAELSIHEICTQASFAEIAYSHINPQIVSGTDAVFSSIHSFLSHCAMVSKMLRAKYESNAIREIGDVLGIAKSSPIHSRTLRNNLEHYDERLKVWIGKHGVDISIGDNNIGPKSALRITNLVFVRHFDPTLNTFTFVDVDYDLGVLFDEVQRIKEFANNWVMGVEGRAISPPFI